MHEVALQHYQNGGKRLFVDEIHKYENWSGEIKHIYDSISQMQLVFTGSSILDILKGYGDLSRRAATYMLHGLSFREYLNYELNQDFAKVDLEKICKGELIDEIDKPYFHFNNYLQKGYYPFYKEGAFEQKLLNVINAILEVDLLQYLDLRASTIGKLKKLLQIIAESVPFKPNLSKIAEKTSISRNLLLEYLSYMERAGLIHLVPASPKGIQGLSKPEKIYLNNPNLSYCLSNSQQVDTGNVRETFFLSQLSVQFQLNIPKKGDFQWKDQLFQIGGINKTVADYKEQKHITFALDKLEVPFKNQIPLWHFGFLY